MPWYGFAIISALAIAAVGLVQKKTLQHEHSLEYATFFNIAKLALFLIVFGGQMVWAISSVQLGLVIATGIIGSLTFLVVAKAMRRLELHRHHDQTHQILTPFRNLVGDRDGRFVLPGMSSFAMWARPLSFNHRSANPFPKPIHWTFY